MARVYRIAAVVLVVVLSRAAMLAAAEALDHQPFLSHPVLEPGTALKEVQAFCESRIVAMPAVKSAGEWERQAATIRSDVLEKIVFRGEAKAWRDAKTKVEWLDAIEGGPGYRIRKLRYEALPGLWVPALLYEPLDLAGKGKVPVVLNLNGHDSNGKTAPYKQIICINQAKRGMLALNIEWLGMGQLGDPGFAHYRMNQLDLCGTSGLAPFYLVMSRAIDLLLAHEHADPERLAVTGLSGGGWQTIVISSLDPRVKLADPVAGYSSFRTRVRHVTDLGDSEQTPSDLAAVADYTHLTALMAPRPTLLTYNAKDDCCFASGHALPPLVDAAGPVFGLYGKRDHLRTHVNEEPGTHNYEKDNRQAFYRMLGDHFFASDPAYSAAEIPSDGEVKPIPALQVDLPPEKVTFNTLALSLAKGLPRQPGLPADKAAAEAWLRDGRAKLREIVRFREHPVAAERTGGEERDGLKVTYWRLKVGSDWTVPAVELAQGTPRTTAIVVHDGGRAASAEAAKTLLASGHRVLAVDPFYTGESKIGQADALYALLVASVGERPLGVQAGQLAAVARWAHGAFGAPATLVAVGRRASMAALTAAALEEKAVGSAELHEALGSLKDVLEQNHTVQDMPEMFCFGLLESFDVAQITALAAPRPVRFVNPSDRARAELAPLKGWYALFGANFDPVR